MVYYPNFKNIGIREAISLGDGYTIHLSWHQAYLNNPQNGLAYHIYFSTDIMKVFDEGPKFISIDGSTQVDIFDFTPGQLYHFAVRAIEYDPTLIDINDLPIVFSGLAVYPESLLSSNISATDGYVPLLDIEGFPEEGIVKVGVELIEYLSVNTSTNQLIVPTGSGVPGHLVWQGDGYYVAGSNNIGDGYVNDLAILPNVPALTETWTLKCVFVEGDGYARFIAEGSLSGVARDGYSNVIVWNTDNVVRTGGVLSFAIQQGLTQFVLGDYFTVKVMTGVNPYALGRGFYNTQPRMHNIDGYDGYYTWSPIVSFLLGKEEINSAILPVQSHFEFDQFQYTIPDGYHQVTSDILTTNLTASDASNVNFNSYDYAGWHRTDPTLLLNGECVGSYIGGEQYCADGYSGVGMKLRGLSFQERNNQREEMLLEIDNEPMVLLQRQWTGITCDCYMPSGEYPDDRCPKCYGTKFVMGYAPYYNPRISDGRIMVRVGPADDIVKQYEAGLESESILDCWTLVVPQVRQRDVLVRFDQDDNEEFRYEIINVNRNRTLARLSGAQKFRIQRIRKTDPAYQIPIFRNTQYFPITINTNIASSPGILPHTHTIVLSENYMQGQPQLTSVNQGHNHDYRLVNGIWTISETIGHSHGVIYPIIPPPIES